MAAEPQDTTTSGGPWLTADQQRIWRTYLSGSLALIDALEQALKVHDLSLSEYEVMVRLSEADGRRVRMSDLAASVNNSRSRLTHTIARMERAGLVERVTCADDRRGVWAQLTERGWATLVATAPAHVRSVRDNLVEIVEPTDLEAVGRAFAAVLANLGREPA